MSGRKKKLRRDRSERAARRQVQHRGHGLKAFDLHLPVFAFAPGEDGNVRTPKPIVYGTAFPVGPGLFATAAHVVDGAQADGIVGLSHITVAGASAPVHEVQAIEKCDAIDLALLRCDSLSHLQPIPIDFDRRLDFLANVSSVGFPMSLEVEFVTCIPRAFGGHVVTRRELYHLPGQPAGYEVSFYAPQGLSGAPLISTHFGKAYCYGYVIQQSTIGMGDQKTPVGIAVDIGAMLSVKSKFGPQGALAGVFGREFVAAPRPSERRLPGGVPPPSASDLTDWPDDIAEEALDDEEQ